MVFDVLFSCLIAVALGLCMASILLLFRRIAYLKEELRLSKTLYGLKADATLLQYVEDLTAETGHSDRLIQHFHDGLEYMWEHMVAAQESLDKIKNRHAALELAVARFRNWKEAKKEDPDYYVNRMARRKPMTDEEVKLLEAEYEGV